MRDKSRSLPNVDICLFLGVDKGVRVESKFQPLSLHHSLSHFSVSSITSLIITFGLKHSSSKSNTSKEDPVCSWILEKLANNKQITLNFLLIFQLGHRESHGLVQPGCDLPASPLIATDVPGPDSIALLYFCGSSRHGLCT